MQETEMCLQVSSVVSPDLQGMFVLIPDAHLIFL